MATPTADFKTVWCSAVTSVSIN